jgi:PAS domain S-box-containing protein/putative nucleotidyltransferase with HDIG domain
MIIKKGLMKYCEGLKDLDKKTAALLCNTEIKFHDLVENVCVIIFTVDLNSIITYINPAVESLLGFKASDIINCSFTEIVHPEDKMLSQEHFEKVFCGEKANCEYRAICKGGDIRWYRTMSQPLYEGDKIAGAQGTIIDITTEKIAEKTIESSYQKLESVFEDTVEALASILGQRDPFTQGHQRNVTKLACTIATKLNLSAEKIKGIRLAGLLHDIGKISIPAEILSKPSKLTDAEYRLVKTHPQIAYEILKKIDFPWPIAQIVLQHHERLDGSGYPQGLNNNEILQEAKILIVADVVEAMFSHRPYRPAPGASMALKEIVKNRGIKYDAASVDVCLKTFKKEHFTF